MTPTELSQQARERAAKATPGPWHWHSGIEMLLGRNNEITLMQEVVWWNGNHLDDAAFIAAARTDVPALCDAIDAQAQEIVRLRGALVAMVDAYVTLVNSGDAGFWNPENDDAVLAARAALQEPTR